MQSPPGAQGHWRPAGGRRSVHVQMCTRSHPTGAACKPHDSTAGCFPYNLCLFSLYLSCYLISLHSVSLISSPGWHCLDVTAAWHDLMWFSFISFASSMPLVSFPVFVQLFSAWASPFFKCPNLTLCYTKALTHEWLQWGGWLCCSCVWSSQMYKRLK